MLERIREGSQGPMVKIILGLIIVAFALTGVNAYLGGSAETYVAKVNGVEITQSDFERAYQNKRAQMEEQFGDFFDYLAADEGYMSQMRAGVLNELVEEKLGIEFAQRVGMRQTPDTLRQMIRNLPDFQVNGQFSTDVYNRALMNMGLSSRDFARFIEEQIVHSLTLRGLLLSEFALPHEIERLQVLENEQRSGRYFVFSHEDYTAEVEVSESEIAAWYDEHAERFEVEEKIQLEYLEVSFDALAAQVEITDEAVRQEYEQNIASFTTQEERQIAHILFETEAGEAQAKARAEAALARLNQGESFAELAEELSDDLFSAEDGGDLGVLERGGLDPQLEEAGFALQNEGDYSGIVHSVYGFHIIQLTHLEKAEQVPFEEVAQSIKERLVYNEAEQLFGHLKADLAQYTFEVYDTLSFAAEKLGLEVKQSPMITRAQPPAGFSDPEILAEAFGSSVKNEQINSDLIDLGDRALVIRSLEYEAAHTKELTEVKDLIKTQLVREKSQQRALEASELALAALQAGESVQVESVEISATNRFNSELPNAVAEALFKQKLVADNPTLSAITVQLDTGDAAIVVLHDVVAGTAVEDEEALASYQEQFVGRLIDLSYRELMSALTNKADIVRKRI